MPRQPNERCLQRCGFSIFVHPPRLMDDRVVEDVVDLHVVRVRRVDVEDHVTIQQELPS